MVRAQRGRGEVPRLPVGTIEGRGAKVRRICFEGCGAAMAEPRYGLTCGSEPGTAAFHAGKQVAVGCVPEALGSKAPIVPVDGDYAAEADCIRQDLVEYSSGLGGRKLHPRRVKKRGIHDVKR